LGIKELAAAISGTEVKPNFITQIRRSFYMTLPEKNRKELISGFK
jgi:hypothetical protein